MNFEDALGLARTAMNVASLNADEAVASQPLIPEEMRAEVRAALERELESRGAMRFRDLRMLEASIGHVDWLRDADRQEWVYWPRLRHHLLNAREWPQPAVQSIDDATDRILASLEDPTSNRDFDRRGLVVGYVQSGKTANYSALIAKAADTGYRLFIVLTGIHNQLRQQTQRRLNAELVGSEPGGIAPPGEDRRRWLTFTTTHLHGDFTPGTVDTAALAGGQPALIVSKKNATVLRRLNDWLQTLPAGTRAGLPVLVIDDEADQASPNTRNNRPFSDVELVEDEEPADSAPSTINELIRGLLNGFPRVAYVAYTATPFANVLIDHQAEDSQVGADIYPRSFIVDLPRPPDYYGPERIFGFSEDAESEVLDVIRHVPDDDVPLLVPASRDDVDDFEPQLPGSLRTAIDDFVLAGAARYQRGDGDEPATMLVHTTHYTRVQDRLHSVVAAYVTQLRDEWRYNWQHGLEERLRTRWEDDFRRITRSEDASADVDFDAVREHIGAFLEHPVETVQLNSASEDELDYNRDTSLKVIVVGGNRLSRGLTLEGLLVSYYVRRANAYDTLMQMGRWFGYRSGHADLTRIYTTPELEQWFRDLVSVEAEVREDIWRYAEEGLTPVDFGVRIRRHPALLVTDRLKMRTAQVERMSFAGQLVQTIVFPFHDRDWLQANLDVTSEFLAELGTPDEGVDTGHPMWRGVGWEEIVEFMESYETDPSAVRVNRELLLDFLRRQAEQEELVEWVVGVMGQPGLEHRLGSVDLGVGGIPTANLIERTRLRDSSSLGVLTSPAHLGLGLSDEQRERARTDSGAPSGRRLREVRYPREGLLLVYPVSRFSGWDGEQNVAKGDRVPIYDDPGEAADMADIVGIAIAMPPSSTAATVEYVVGTVGVGDS